MTARSPQPPANFAIAPPLRRSDLPGLCARVCEWMDREAPEVAICDVRGFDRVDAVVVDALARLQLAAQRRGIRLRLVGAGRELAELIRLMGLEAVLPDL